EIPQEDSSVGGQQRVCRSVIVGGQGVAVSGMLDLPDRPQTGRWYLTARAACEAAPGTAARHKQRSLRRSTEGADIPTTSAASQDEGVPGTGGGVPSARAAAASPPAAAVGQEEEEKNIYSGTGWGLEVMSLQRDWAHVEWSADFLVPGVGDGGGDARRGGDDGKGEGGREACTSAAGGEDAFVFRAAAFTEACPRGAVGVGGVDLRPVTAAAAA
ncbi:unnamed protein product, partial [Ectocarpus sp. 13 AM-2016]